MNKSYGLVDLRRRLLADDSDLSVGVDTGENHREKKIHFDGCTCLRRLLLAAGALDKLIRL